MHSAAATGYFFPLGLPQNMKNFVQTAPRQLPGAGPLLLLTPYPHRALPAVGGYQICTNVVREIQDYLTTFGVQIPW